VSLPNGVSSTYTFDASGRLSSLAHHRGTTLLSNFQYSYDLSGNRLQAVEDVRQLVQSAGTGTPPDWTPPGWTPMAQFAVEEAGYLAVPLAWTDAAIEDDGYTLERSTDGQNWIAVAELSANTLRYVDYGLARHTLDWCQVLAPIGPGQSHSMLKWVHDQHPSAVYRGFLCHHL